METWKSRKLLEALKKVELKDVPGGHEIRQLRNPIQNIYVRSRKSGGELQNTVIHTIERLSVLEVQTRRIPEAARLFAEYPP